ncbi:MAG TPA: class I SAM-dependent methyltransferase [Pyrinomonadaceae bacterium]|nr:class I SAM-dependent methyltransferase [Pyrinomonadaceae bacterium]
MISLEERERAEIHRSACDARQSTKPLVVPAETIARYCNSPATTVFPLEYAFHLLGDVNGKTVLEYGCGGGTYTVALARRGARVIAFDISPDLLALAKKRVEANECEGVQLLLGSAHSLPFPDESIDVIFGMAILHHLDLEIASSELMRVLRKGGRAIFKEPLRNSKLYTWLRQFLPKRANVSPFERPFTDSEIKDFAQPYTYRDKTFQLPLSRIAHVLPFWSESAVRLCAYVDTFLLRLFPSLTYYATVKVFEIQKGTKEE